MAYEMEWDDDVAGIGGTMYIPQLDCIYQSDFSSILSITFNSSR